MYANSWFCALEKAEIQALSNRGFSSVMIFHIDRSADSVYNRVEVPLGKDYIWTEQSKKKGKIYDVTYSVG
jgi:hypothetical protein